MGKLRSAAGRVGIRRAQANYTAAQTDTSLVAAPAAGYNIVLHRFDLSSQIAGSAFLESSATQVGRTLRAQADGSDGFWDVELRLAAATALTVTTDIAGAHSVYVEYSVRRRGDAQPVPL